MILLFRHDGQAATEALMDGLRERDLETTLSPMPVAVICLAKNSNGYCPDHSTGVSCPIGVGVKAD